LGAYGETCVVDHTETTPNTLGRHELPTGTSSLYTAADRNLQARHGISLTDWLDAEVAYRSQRHPQGNPNWRLIASRLTEESGVPVSHETARRWHSERKAA
jgi:hypothetical protein